MYQKVRELECVEKLYWSIWLFDFGSRCGRKNILCSWRAFPEHKRSERLELNWQIERNSSGGSHVRHFVVGSRPDWGLVSFRKRSRIHFWPGHSITILPQQRTVIDCPSASIGNGGVQVHVQRETGDSVVGTELLLQMWEHSVDNGVGWEFAKVL